MGNLRHAIILAGGKGERLRPFTNDRPKPMVEVGGKPILAYQLRQLQKAGIENVIFACSYQREVLQKHLGDGSKYGVKAEFSIEESPLGRGGGIKQAMHQIGSGFEDVLVTNGDNLWKLDIKKLVSAHKKKEAIATIVVAPLKSPYGVIEFNKACEVLRFREKPVLPHWINAGVYIFSKEIEPFLPDVGDHEETTFPMLPKRRFLVFQSTDYWRAVDTVKDLTEAEKEVAQHFKGLV